MPSRRLGCPQVDLAAPLCAVTVEPSVVPGCFISSFLCLSWFHSKILSRENTYYCVACSHLVGFPYPCTISCFRWRWRPNCETGRRDDDHACRSRIDCPLYSPGAPNTHPHSHSLCDCLYQSSSTGKLALLHCNLDPLSIHASVHLSIHPSIRPSVHLFMYSSTYF